MTADYGRWELRIVLGLVGLLAFALPARADCLAYGGRVEVAGTLVRRVYAGPPSYESVARGDRPEAQFVIRLDQEDCVRAGAQPDEAALPSVREMMLVLEPAQFGRLRPRLGTAVVLSGELAPAITGHHHTPVMLAGVALVK